MTREEAIAILDMSKHMATSGRMYNQAIDMAIEALQREEAEAKGYCHRIKPKLDMISREDAIKAIRKCKFESDMPSYWYRGMEDAQDIIENIPLAELPKGDLISRADAVRWVKTECNPYGKPTLDYDSGLRVIEHLKKMPSALLSADAEKGGDAEVNETKSPYMQQSRHDDGRIEVVRCKDCRHADECHKSVQYTRNEPRTVTIGYSQIKWCSRGERSEE